MVKLVEIVFIALVIEGFLYGLYSGIFATYLQIQASKKDGNKRQNTIFYSICALYVLSVAIFVCDIAFPLYNLISNLTDLSFPIYFVQSTSVGFCDFIAQCILIYRCWIVWGCNFRVVTIPTLLAFAFLGTWLASNFSVYISLNQVVTPRWGYLLTPTSFALSLTVNALVTGLIVFRIFKVFQEVKAISDDQILRATGGNKLRTVIFVLIESGMALFSIQVAWLVLKTVKTDTTTRGYLIVNSIYDMLIGITPTIILVRISMGLSFHDEKSMEEAVIGSLRFASDHLNSVPSIGIVGQERRDDDIINIQRNNDIELVDR